MRKVFLGLLFLFLMVGNINAQVISLGSENTDLSLSVLSGETITAGQIVAIGNGEK